MGKLKAVLAEDEKLARQRLRRLLKAFPEVEISGEAGDGTTALEMVNRLKPDVLFLDIEMPEKSGVEIVRHFEHVPYIIFTTAYDRYAVEAFEIGAVDYLLKPITAESIDRALGRVRDRLERSPMDADALSRIVETLEGIRREAPGPSVLTVKQGDRYRVLDVDRIRALKAEDRYVICHAESGEHVLDDTIKNLARTLDHRRFIRVHRGIIVNISAIRDVRRSLFTKSGYEVTVEGLRDPLPVGKTYLAALRERLGF